MRCGHPSNNETIVFTTRQHWVAPVVHSGRAILLVLGSIALGWIEPRPSRTLPGFVTRCLQSIRSGIFLGGGGWIVFNVVAWRAAEYSVSNRRIVGHDGLFQPRTADRSLTSVSDVRTARSMLGSRSGIRQCPHRAGARGRRRGRFFDRARRQQLPAA